MANSSDWIADMAESPGQGRSPSWITALAQGGASADFRSGSPFTSVAEPIVDVPQEPEAPDPTDLAHERGFTEGYEAARAEAEAQRTQDQENWRGLKLAFRTLDKTAMDALASDLQATVIALCGDILRDYALDQNALIQRCDAAAERLGSAPGKLTLRLHPETLSALGDGALESWQAQPDPALERGALCLEAEDGSVSDGPGEWVRAIRAALGSGEVGAL